MDCLAAQLIAHFKKEAGGFYLYSAGTRDCGEEYIYTIYLDQNTRERQPRHLRLKLQAGAMTYFGLPGTKQTNMPIIYDGTVDNFDPEQVQKAWSDRDVEPVNDFIDDQVLSSEIIGTE